MANMNQLMKQVQKMQAEMEKVQAELENETVEGSAGGGMVRAIVNGRRDLLEIKIDPEVVNAEETEMLEELVVSAVNQAVEKATELQTESLSKITGGMPLPGMGL
ncbi:MAG: YbaB/EbfC family nucleoid-associated protein [candidate division Zixibacteria bacterium]|nr:YbaB/EbfC family nucleoid-associated protein [candidate division Zixibacteria bacterium]